MKAKRNYHAPPPWFRLYNELADDPKIRRVAVMTEQHELIITGLWVKLLIIANVSHVRGELRMAIDLPYTLEDISYDVRLPMDQLEALLDAMIRVEMLHKDGDCYVITHFFDRQYKSDTDGAERVRRYRQRKAAEKKQAAGDDSSNDYTKLQYHNSNVTVTPPETETESDTDTNVVGEKPPPADRPKKRLMSTFQSATGLKMPHKKPDIGFWYSNIGEIYKITDECYEDADQLIKLAVKKLRDDRLTIGGPESIVKTCRALWAERSNGNYGKETGHALTAEQVAAAKRLEELERSGAPSP